MKRITLLLSLAFLATTACKKDKDEEPTPTPPPAGPSATHMAELSVGHTVDDYGIGSFELTSATGFITTTSYDQVDVDSVRLNQLRMNNVSSGIYSVSEHDGLDLSTGALSWELMFTAQGISFTHDASAMGFPTISAITSAANVPSGSPYTLSCGSVTGADSVSFTLGTVHRTLAGNVASHTFTAAEIATMAPGQYPASIRAYRQQSARYGGMACRFINFEKRSVMVQVQ